MIIDRGKKIIYEVVIFVATFFVSKKMIVALQNILNKIYFSLQLHTKLVFYRLDNFFA